MHALGDFEFLTILNLLVVVLWPATGAYTGASKDAVGIIMLIFTVIAVLMDIFFLVLKVAR